jgi:hypothetical protein
MQESRVSIIEVQYILLYNIVMSAHQESGPVPNTPPSTAELLHDAYYAGLSLAQMAPLPGVTIDVAQKYGLYTSTEPQDPGTFKEYYKARQLERALDSIADATEERFRDVEEFASSFEDGTFPLALAKSFDAITSIHGENVHLKNQRTVDGRNDGDIFIGKTIFTVERGSAKLLHTVFNELLHKNLPKDNIQRPDVHRPIMRDEEGREGRPSTVTITNVSEHDIRAIGRAVDVLILRRFRDLGVRLPANKMSFSGWSDWGNTFPYPSEVVDFMQGVAMKYIETPATATYHPDYNKDNLKPVPRVRGPLGTDASGIFQRWRNIINGLGHHLRGSSAYNLEQNPNPLDRISLEEGIELRRDAITQEQAEYGPASPRTLTGIEVAAESIRRKIGEAKQDKLGAVAKGAKSALSFGLIDLALGMVAKLPKGLKRTRELSSDATAYREQQRAVRASAEVLKHVVWHEVMGPRFRELDEQRAKASKPSGENP